MRPGGAPAGDQLQQQPQQQLPPSLAAAGSKLLPGSGRLGSLTGGSPLLRLGGLGSSVGLGLSLPAPAAPAAAGRGSKRLRGLGGAQRLTLGGATQQQQPLQSAPPSLLLPGMPAAAAAGGAWRPGRSPSPAGACTPAATLLPSPAAAAAHAPATPALSAAAAASTSKRRSPSPALPGGAAKRVRFNECVTVFHLPATDSKRQQHGQQQAQDSEAPAAARQQQEQQHAAGAAAVAATTVPLSGGRSSTAARSSTDAGGSGQHRPASTRRSGGDGSAAAHRSPHVAAAAATAAQAVAAAREQGARVADVLHDAVTDSGCWSPWHKRGGPAAGALAPGSQASADMQRMLLEVTAGRHSCVTHSHVTGRALAERLCQRACCDPRAVPAARTQART